MVIESGAIYPSALIAVLVTYVLGNPASFIITDFVCPELIPSMHLHVLNYISPAADTSNRRSNAAFRYPIVIYC